MRNYNYKNKWQKLLTPEVVSLLTQIHEYKGEQTLFIEAKADSLMQPKALQTLKELEFFGFSSFFVFRTGIKGMAA